VQEEEKESFYSFE